MSKISVLEPLAIVLVIFKPIGKEVCDNPDYFFVDVILGCCAIGLLEQRVKMVPDITLVELGELFPLILDWDEVNAIVQSRRPLDPSSKLSTCLEPLGLLEPLQFFLLETEVWAFCVAVCPHVYPNVMVNGRVPVK